MTQKMLDVLECCKQHDGPVTAKDIEKLNSYTESEIIAETETQSWVKICEIYKNIFFIYFFCFMFCCCCCCCCCCFFYFCLLFELYEYNQRRSVIFTIETTQIDGFVF